MPDGKKKRELAAWFDELRDRVTSLDWTTDIVTEWAEMVNRVKQAGYTIGIMDTMIAATARHHGLIVATRNVLDFQRCGVQVVNPFE